MIRTNLHPSPPPRFEVSCTITIEQAPPPEPNFVVVARRPEIAMDVYGGEHLCEYPSGAPWVGPWPRYGKIILPPE